METNSGDYKAKSIICIKSIFKCLSSLSPMDFTLRKQFSRLYGVLDGKIKHVAE